MLLAIETSSFQTDNLGLSNKKIYDVPWFVFYNPGTDWQFFLR